MFKRCWKLICRWKTSFLLVLATLLGGCIVLWFWLTPSNLPLWQDPTPYMLARHGQLRQAVSVSSSQQGNNRIDYFRLVSSSGLAVDLAVRFDPHDDRQRPLVLLIGGHNTGQEAVRLLDEVEGAVVAGLDYPYHGNHKPKGFAVARALPEMRRALYDTPPAMMLALDFLLSLATVDPEQVELVGVSLGAPLVCVAGALDARFSRVWAIQGGGDLDVLFDHNLQSKFPNPLLRKPLAGFAHAITKSLAPERFVDQISPRPFVLVSAREDQRIPESCAQALFDAAREPKQRIFTEGGHVLPKHREIVRDLYQIVRQRL